MAGEDLGMRASSKNCKWPELENMRYPHSESWVRDPLIVIVHHCVVGFVTFQDYITVVHHTHTHFFLPSLLPSSLFSPCMPLPPPPPRHTHLPSSLSASDGPCAIRFSRLKSSDAAAYNPSPAEIVRRHNQ